jgi:hypothetical protein
VCDTFGVTKRRESHRLYGCLLRAVLIANALIDEIVKLLC